MKTAALLVSFGTSHQDARTNSLEQIYKELAESCASLPVFQAYTSGRIIRKLSGQGVGIDTMEEAIQKALDQGIECLYVVPTLMIPGIEYEKLLAVTAKYQSVFRRLSVARPVLAGKEQCQELVPVLQDMLQFRPDCEYVLMGHGTEAQANIRYEQMNEAFGKAGLTNVRIASVEAKPDLEDAISDLKKKYARDQKAGTAVSDAGRITVILHPFMVVAGDHAKNDMAGENDSFTIRLAEAGYRTEAIVKGLGEYPAFRQLYVDRLKEMICVSERQEQDAGEIVWSGRRAGRSGVNDNKGCKSDPGM